MLSVPLLADFAVRLSFGLILTLLLTSWREVPLRFFRIQNQVILATLVLAGLDQARSRGASMSVGLIVAGVILAYLATVSWGLGLPRVGIAAGILGAVVTSLWMIDASRSDHPVVWTLNSLSRISSGGLMGATLTAMLLGHYYLIAPSMTTEPSEAITQRDPGGPRRTWFAGRHRRLGHASWSFWARDSAITRRMRRSSPCVGDGIRGRRGVGLPGPPHGRDPLDTIGDRNPLHHDDLRVVRGARLAGGVPVRASSLEPRRTSGSNRSWCRTGQRLLGSRAFCRAPLSLPTGSITIRDPARPATRRAGSPGSIDWENGLAIWN